MKKNQQPDTHPEVGMLVRKQNIFFSIQARTKTQMLMMTTNVSNKDMKKKEESTMDSSSFCSCLSLL